MVKNLPRSRRTDGDARCCASANANDGDNGHGCESANDGDRHGDHRIDGRHGGLHVGETLQTRQSTCQGWMGACASGVSGMREWVGAWVSEGVSDRLEQMELYRAPWNSVSFISRQASSASRTSLNSYINVSFVSSNEERGSRAAAGRQQRDREAGPTRDRRHHSGLVVVEPYRVRCGLFGEPLVSHYRNRYRYRHPSICPEPRTTNP